MRPGLRHIWESIHEPKIVTIVTVLCYFTISLYGVYGLVAREEGFWVLSSALMACTAPVSLVAAWTGRWQFERPLMYPIVAGLLTDIVLSLAYLPSGPSIFRHIVTIALVAQVFVSRWVRIKTSYVSPAIIDSELRQKLDD